MCILAALPLRHLSFQSQSKSAKKCALTRDFNFGTPPGTRTLNPRIKSPLGELVFGRQVSREQHF